MNLGDGYTGSEPLLFSLPHHDLPVTFFPSFCDHSLLKVLDLLLNSWVQLSRNYFLLLLCSLNVKSRPKYLFSGKVNLKVPIHNT